MPIGKYTMGVEEFLDLPVPEQRWLVEGLLPHPSLGELYAKRGMGKTWVAMSLGMAVAHGWPWLTAGLRAEVQRPVLYVDGEMTKGQLQDRFRGLLGGHKPSEVMRIASLAGVAPIPNFANDAEWQALGEMCRELGVEFVVLDNWACLVRGVDENDNKRTAEVMAGPVALRAQGISVLWVHHAGKAGTQRGASSREDALDYVFSLEGVGSSGGPAKVQVEMDKSRQLVEWEPVTVELRAMPEGGLKWCATEDTMPRGAKKVLEDLRSSGPGTASKLRERTNLNGERMGLALNWLQEHGMIVRGDYGWAAR